MRLLTTFAGAGVLVLGALLALQAISPAQVPLPRPKPLERLAVATAPPPVADGPRSIATIRVIPPKAAVAAVPQLPAAPTAVPLTPDPEIVIKKPPEEVVDEDRSRRR